MIYEMPDGSQRIRFDAENARTLQDATPDRNWTTDNRAGLNDDGEVFVHEGRHRSIGAAQGGAIDPSNGGVPGSPGALDFNYEPDTTPEKGVPVKNLKIDPAQDVPADEADQKWKDKYGIK